MPEFTSQNAIVLSSRPLGEGSFIVSVFTFENGRHLGVLKKKTPPEIGTLCQVRWKARLADQLGTFYLEETKSYAAMLLDDMPRLNVLSTLCSLLNQVLPERQAYPELHERTRLFLTHMEEDNFYADYVRFEVDLLSALGFALDMSTCAGGGDRLHLAYISPKTGRAVSKEKGWAYRDKLLKLPGFLWKDEVGTPEDWVDGLQLTGYFLHKHLDQLPSVRTRLFSDIQRRFHG